MTEILKYYALAHGLISFLLLVTFAIYKGSGKRASWKAGLFLSALGPVGLPFLFLFP